MLYNKSYRTALCLLFSVVACDPGSTGPETPTEYTLTVTLDAGVEGFPAAGSYTYPPGEHAKYGYQTMHGYSDLKVRIDGFVAPPADSILMNRNHTLSVTCTQKILWQFDVEQAVYYASPAIGDDGTIYFGSGIYLRDLGGYRPGTVYAVNPDGTLKWSYFIGTSLFSPAIGENGDIYIMDHAYTVYAFSPAGILRWTFDDYDESGFVKRDVGQRTPAVGSDGTVYVGGDGLYALDPADGSRMWHFHHPQPVRECIASPVIGADNTIYIVIGQDSLYAVNPNGTRRWAFGFDYPEEMSFACPAIDDGGVIYIPSESYHSSTIYAVNPDGTRKWRYLLSINRVVRASPAIAADGSIIFATKAGGLDVAAWVLALDPDGNRIWEYVLERVHQTPDDIYSSPAAGADGTIYFGAETGSLYALNSNGTLRWRYEIGAMNWSSPALTPSGALYIGIMPNSMDYTGALCAVVSSSHGYADSPWPRFRHDRRNTGRFTAPID